MLAQVADGTSNTLMIGEADGGRESGRTQCHGSWMGVGVLPTWGGLPRGGEEFMGAVHFSSKHSGIVQFCFADGSVRTAAVGYILDRLVELGVSKPVAGRLSERLVGLSRVGRPTGRRRSPERIASRLRAVRRAIP